MAKVLIKPASTVFRGCQLITLQLFSYSNNLTNSDPLHSSTFFILIIFRTKHKFESLMVLTSEHTYKTHHAVYTGIPLRHTSLPHSLTNLNCHLLLSPFPEVQTDRNLPASWTSTVPETPHFDEKCDSFSITSKTSWFDNMMFPKINCLIHWFVSLDTISK